MASTSMVLSSSGNGNPSTPNSPSTSRHTLAPTSIVVAFGHLVTERSSFLWLGYSLSMTSTLLASNKQSTNRIYNASWKSFIRWSSRKGVDPLNQVSIGFFTRWAGQWSQVVHTRRQVAALATVLSQFKGISLPNHPYMRRFLKGAALKDSPQIYRFHMWKLPTVPATLTRPLFELIREILIK